MLIIGISAFYHDSAVSVIEDGRIVAAAQEERFTRQKHDSAFPINALKYCVKEAGVSWADIGFVSFYEKPLLKGARLLRTYLENAPRGFRAFSTAFPIWAQNKLFHRSLLCHEFERLAPGINWRTRLLFAEHHVSHAASAFFASPFDSAAVLTVDGVGEFATTSVSIGLGNELIVQKEIHFPHSLGLLYSAFTDYVGFKVNSGEYKLMGLAPYGSPRFSKLICDKLMDLKDDGSFSLNMDYFDYCTGFRMINDRFCELFGQPARRPDGPFTQFYMDVAASIQQVLNEALVKMVRNVRHETGMTNLCLAGGVALNCVSNAAILRDRQFRHLWIQPAAGDAGGALGAALAAYYGFLGKPRANLGTGRDLMHGSYLGPEFSQQDIEDSLTKSLARFCTLSDTQLLDVCSRDLIAEKAVGWYQGRMEFGPRALGNRSILADPRSPLIQSTLNLKVKFRESFRPFAPSVLYEDLSKYFDLDVESPYMLLTAEVLEGRRRPLSDEEANVFGVARLNLVRSDIPGVTHLDYSARVQTVHQETNSRFYSLHKRFKELSECSVLVNTSFNVRGEPIVCTPEDAFRCFMSTGIESLAIGNCYLRKEEQIKDDNSRYSQTFLPD
jgi:carbamoyltransferase